ncbi:hypothetical protein V8E36_001436 [Tilletia maclaganii]
MILPPEPARAAQASSHFDRPRRSVSSPDSSGSPSQLEGLSDNLGSSTRSTPARLGSRNASSDARLQACTHGSDVFAARRCQLFRSIAMMKLHDSFCLRSPNSHAHISSWNPRCFIQIQETGACPALDCLKKIEVNNFLSVFPYSVVLAFCPFPLSNARLLHHLYSANQLRARPVTMTNRSQTSRTQSRAQAPTTPGSASFTMHSGDLRHSCTFCRQRKMKCSGDQPWCKACRERNQPCLYEPNAGKAQAAKRKVPALFSLRASGDTQAAPAQHMPATASSLSSLSTLSSAPCLSPKDDDASSKQEPIDPLAGGSTYLPSAATVEPVKFTLQNVPLHAQKRNAVPTPKKKRANMHSSSRQSVQLYHQQEPPATADGACDDAEPEEIFGIRLESTFKELWESESSPFVSLSNKDAPMGRCKVIAWTPELPAIVKDLVELICQQVSPLCDTKAEDAALHADVRALATLDQAECALERTSKVAHEMVRRRDQHWFSQLAQNVFETQPLVGLVVSKTIFLNDFNNRTEDKLLLNVIIAEALLTLSPEASASLDIGNAIPAAQSYIEDAQALLYDRKCDSDTGLMTIQACVLLAFRSIEQGRIKQALCMLMTSQKMISWLLQDRNENAPTTVLINGIALAEVENELLRNMCWITRGACQWLCLHLGAPLSSPLVSFRAETVTVIPALPPQRPTQSIVRALDEISGHFRALRTQATSISHLHVLAHLSETVSLLNSKLQDAGLSSERIAAELPTVLLDTLVALDPIFVHEPYFQLPYALRTITIHLCLPRGELTCGAEANRPVRLGIQALNHMLMVTVTALTQIISALQVAETDQAQPLRDAASPKPGGIFDCHLGQAVPPAIRLLASAARAVELFLNKCELLVTADTGGLHDHFDITPEGRTFLIERKGQILYLLQQMHEVLRHDALSCSLRRAVKKHVKSLATSLEASGVTSVLITAVARARMEKPAIHAGASLQKLQAARTAASTTDTQTSRSGARVVKRSVRKAPASDDDAELKQRNTKTRKSKRKDAVIPSQARTPPRTPLNAMPKHGSPNGLGPETPPPALQFQGRRNTYGGPVIGSGLITSLWSSPVSAGPNGHELGASQLSQSTSSLSTPWGSQGSEPMWQPPVSPLAPYGCAGPEANPFSSMPGSASGGTHNFSQHQRPHTSAGLSFGSSLGPSATGGTTEPGRSYTDVPLTAPATVPASFGWFPPSVMATGVPSTIASAGLGGSSASGFLPAPSSEDLLDGYVAAAI